MLDVLVRNGWVVDGTGAPAFRADVGVSNGTITEVGPLPGAAAATEIDASGRYVLPGFIDAHVHGDAAVFEEDVQRAALRQGVTTFVLGQDGISFAPAGRETLEFVSRYFAPVNGRHPTLAAPGTVPGIAPGIASVTVADLLATYDGATALNTAYLVPHGTVRHQVLSTTDQPAGPEALRAMRRLIEESLEAGAAGLSTGLEYLPGGYADAAEIAALCAPVAAAGLPYVTHMRGYDQHAERGMAEVAAITRKSAVAAHVSHYHGPATKLTAMIDDARADGLDITFDSYPYLRGSSILALVTLPDWLPSADIEATVDALAEHSVRNRLRRAWADDLWPRIRLSYAPTLEWAEGMTLPEAAEHAKTTSADFCLTLLRETRLEAGCVFAHPATAGEDSVRALLRHPAQMGGSDGIYRGGHPHPRGFGAFARFLRRHVRELGDWTWEQAAVHLAGHPARRFRLTDRGLVRNGQAADLSVINPATVADLATYDNPREPATGVEHVLVNGVHVLKDGDSEGKPTPGRALKPRC